MSRPTRAEIDALMKLAGESTPRPWEATGPVDGGDYLIDSPSGLVGDTLESTHSEADAAYLCAAANAAPALVARVRELSAALASIGCIHPMAGRKAGTTCISLCFSRANYCGVCAALSEKP